MKKFSTNTAIAPEKFRSQLRLLNDAARKVLSAGFGRHIPADRVLGTFFRENRRCGSRDRALISETVYSALRFWGYLRRFLPEERLGEIETGALRLTDRELSALLMAGCFINGDAEPASAAAGALTLPALPRALGNPCARANQMAEYFGCRGAKLHDTDLLPAWVRGMLPEDLDQAAYLKLLSVRPPMWIRLQTDDPEAVLSEIRAVADSVTPHPVIPDAAAVRAKINLYTLESFRGGKFEIQDIASQCVARIAAPRPGERWLDPCAGAGGKTLHLAQLMNRKGTVVAGDIRAEKLDDLRRRARRAGFPNITAKLNRGGTWYGRHPYDGVLVDAPCSCSGVWRRNPGAQWKLKEEDVRELAAVQKKILDDHAGALRVGGVLVYATCSLFDLENSTVVRSFLAGHDEYRLDPFEHPFSGKIVPGMIRIDSCESDCDALFIAKMRRVR